MIEGRAREAIWRDGRWWDELEMSVLDSDWRALIAAVPVRSGAAAVGDRRLPPMAPLDRSGDGPRRSEPGPAAQRIGRWR